MIKIYQERTDTTKRKTSFAFFKTHHDAYLQSHQATCPLDWMVARMCRDVPSTFCWTDWTEFHVNWRLQTQISTLNYNIQKHGHNMWKPRKHRSTNANSSSTAKLSPPNSGSPQVTKDPSSRQRRRQPWPGPGAHLLAGLGLWSCHHHRVGCPM